MKISERARETYTERFWELRDDKRFHFATRVKNHFGVNDFDDFFEEYFSDAELAELLSNNDYSEEELFALCDALLEDKPAVSILSTYAIDTICLCENLFPRNIDVVQKLCEHISEINSPAAIYLVTHIIICDTNFYVRKIGEQHQEIFCKLLAQCEEYISKNFEGITLDIKLEFLVCAKMAGFETGLKEKIRQECEANMAEGYLQDPRHKHSLNTLNGAEHRNSLLMMSEI